VEHGLLLDVIVFLAAGVIAVPIFTRLRLGSVIGYLAAGIVIGPWGLGLIDTVEDVLHFAELGVVLLLFVIGLELNPARLWAMRRQVFGLGSLQVLLSAVVLAAAGHLLGLDRTTAWVAGFGLALSSTAFALQILAERGELYSRYGRTAFAILLFQDLAVVPLLAIVPLLGAGGGPASWADIGWAAAVVAIVIFAGHYLVRPLFRFIAHSRASEVLTAAALLLALGTALLMDLVGMSMGLGAFLAGMLLAESEFRHQLEADIEPFRGLLLGLFFIAVGMSVDMGLVWRELWAILLLAAGLLLAKAAVLWPLVWLFTASPRRATRVALLLPQGGEFAFVLFALAVASGVMQRALSDLLIAVISLSMIATPFIVRLADVLVRRPQRRSADVPERALPEQPNPVIIAGFGRVGQIVGKVLAKQGLGYTAIDPNPEQIQLADQHGFKIHYGDASRADLLHAAGADAAKLIVIAIDDPAVAHHAVQTVKHHFPQLKILARARNRQHALRLMDAKVDLVIRETFESSLELGRHALEMLGVEPEHSRQLVDAFRQEDLSHLDTAIEQLLQNPEAERRENHLQG
jgi:monovalent cation:proton antiporter-2 (CPA2) family protein